MKSLLVLATLAFASCVFASSCDDLGIYASTVPTAELNCSQYATQLGYGFFNTQRAYTYTTSNGKTDVGTVCFGCVAAQDSVPWRN